MNFSDGRWLQSLAYVCTIVVGKQLFVLPRLHYKFDSVWAAKISSDFVSSRESENAYPADRVAGSVREYVFYVFFRISEKNMTFYVFWQVI